jgi:lysozyme
MLQGIDVSSYQGKVDWDGWKRKGLGFAIAKATEGRTIRDSQFARNWSELRRVGLVRGAYHFAHPANDATTEADFFLGTVRPEGLESGDLLVLDLEQTDGRSASHVASWARTWCSRVAKAVGCDPVVYTFLSFAEEGNCAGLGAYPLWIADPSRTAGRPRVPAPWQRWLLHQYDVDPVDADVANVSSAADLRAYGIGGGDDTGIVVSLGAGRDQSVAPGATESIEWHAEYTDKHGLHAADGSSVMVDVSYWALADALVRVSGLRPADPVDIMWTRMTRDGTAVKDDAWRVTYRADPDGTLTASHSGQVGIGSDVRFRLRVYNPNPVPITVSGATTAKITLLSY